MVLNWWQHLPQTLDPIALTIGFFSLRWYAVFFLGGIVIAFLLARFLVRRGSVSFSEEFLADLFLVLFVGALIGGRIGYVVLYNFDYFLHSPLSLVSPYDFSRGVWTGIALSLIHISEPRD